MATKVNAVAPIIVVKKKKKGHVAHHGGSWKVAYADFVTAMMALFIVLWLLNSSQDVRKAIGGYFQDPTGRGREIGSGMAGTGEALELRKAEMKQIQIKLQEAVKQVVKIQKSKDHVQMSVTGEGLRIELLESENGLFFENGNAKPTDTGTELLTTLAKELGQLPNRVMIEGHTDSKPYSGDGGYTNWELSSDRANTARRLMEGNGLRPNQVDQVRGFADQDLRNLRDPEDPKNRRISVIVKYESLRLEPDAPAKPAPGKDPKAGAKPSSTTSPVASAKGPK